MSRYTLITFFLLLLASCMPGDRDSDTPVVSVSILPQQYFIERIAGELVRVNVMIPSGANPATYEPSVSQLRQLDVSRVYLRIGYVGFEYSWMDKIRAANPGMKIANLAEGIVPIMEEEGNHDHLHGHAFGGIDPHIWMSVSNAKIIARNTYNELLEICPDETIKLETNFNLLLQDLDSMHQSITKILAGTEGGSFIIYHPALSYFASEYNLQQFPLEIGGKTPSPAHMKRMVDLGRERKITAILIQKQFDKKNAEVLAKEIGASIIQINPLDPDWYGQMFYIAKQLSTCL